MSTHDRFAVSGGGVADPADDPDDDNDDDPKPPNSGSGRGGALGTPSVGPEERPPRYQEETHKAISGGGVADEEHADDNDAAEAGGEHSG